MSIKVHNCGNKELIFVSSPGKVIKRSKWIGFVKDGKMTGYNLPKGRWKLIGSTATIRGNSLRQLFDNRVNDCNKTEYFNGISWGYNTLTLYFEMVNALELNTTYYILIKT